MMSTCSCSQERMMKKSGLLKSETLLDQIGQTHTHSPDCIVLRHGTEKRVEKPWTKIQASEEL